MTNSPPLPGGHILSIMALSCAAVALYFFPSFVPSLVLTTLIGLLIFDVEYKSGLNPPMSPAFMFWGGFFVTYVIGNIGYILLSGPNPPIEEHAWQLTILNLALCSFMTAYFLIILPEYSNSKDRNPWITFNMPDRAVWKLLAILTIPFIAMQMTPQSLLILASEVAKNPLLNILAGFFRILGPFIAVLLGLYFIGAKKRSYLLLFLLFLFSVGSLGIHLEATLSGSRIGVIQSLVFPLAVIIGYAYRYGLLRTYLPLAVVIVLIIALYIPVADIYRFYSGYRSADYGLGDIGQLPRLFNSATTGVLSQRSRQLRARNWSSSAYTRKLR